MISVSKMWAMAGAAMTVGMSGLALAQDIGGQDPVTGKPTPGGWTLQHPVTPVAREMEWFDDLLLFLVFGITVFVLALLGYAVWRYHESRNPTPARFTHNAKLEVAWTAVPVLILVIMAVPSLRLLFVQLDVPETDLTIKATGYQWYWGYEYPDHDISFEAIMLQREELEEYGYQPDEYLLATDTRLVVPVDTNVHLLVTGADVIHNFAMPSFGLKVDAIPGRVNESWFRAERTGTFFGQCSELCGINHAYMPLVIEVVSQEEYETWLNEQVAARRGDRDVAMGETGTRTE